MAAPAPAQLESAREWTVEQFLAWLGPAEAARFCEFVRARGLAKGKAYPEQAPLKVPTFAAF
jgi:hypothetical protein